MASDSLTAAALDAAALGYPVFPIVPGSKAPPAVRHWEQRATTDVDRIRRCWRTGSYNVGIATGRAGRLVVDLDVVKAGEQDPDGFRHGLEVLAVLANDAGQPLPTDTRTVSTPSGGLHLYFLAPSGVEYRNSAKRLGRLIDTRAHGGYVVAPGSIIGDRRYELTDNSPELALPDWIGTALRQEPLPPRQPVSVDLSGSRAGRYVDAALRNEVAKVLDAKEGTRNHTLFAAAVALGQLVAGGSVPVAVVETALEQAAVSIGLSAWEVRNTIESGLKNGAQRPRRLDAA